MIWIKLKRDLKVNFQVSRDRFNTWILWWGSGQQPALCWEKCGFRVYLVGSVTESKWARTFSSLADKHLEGLSSGYMGPAQHGNSSHWLFHGGIFSPTTIEDAQASLPHISLFLIIEAVLCCMSTLWECWEILLSYNERIVNPNKAKMVCLNKVPSI